MTIKHEYNPPTSDPHIPGIRNCGCAVCHNCGCAVCQERKELRAEVQRLRIALAGLISVDNLSGEEFDRRVVAARELLANQ